MANACLWPCCECSRVVHALPDPCRGVYKASLRFVGWAHLLRLGVRVGRRVVAWRGALVVARGRGLLVGGRGRRGLGVAAQLDGAFAPGGRHHVAAGAIWVRGAAWWGEQQGRVRR